MEINEFENRIYKLFVDLGMQLRSDNFYQKIKIQNENNPHFFKDPEYLCDLLFTGPTPLSKADHWDLKKLAHEVVRCIQKMNEESACDEK